MKSKITIVLLLTLLIGNLRAQATTQASLCGGDPTASISPFEKALLEVDQIKAEASAVIEQAAARVPRNRLSSCPMAATSGQSILEKLNMVYSSLQGTKCESQSKETMQSLGAILKEMDTLATLRTGSALEDTARSTEDTERRLASPLLQKSQRALDLIGALSSSEKCTREIRSQGLGLVIADMVTNFSSMAQTISTSLPLPLSGHAATFAAGGKAIGSVVSILHNLLTPSFKWSDFDERRQFVDLVCSFYTTRVELDNMNFFNIKLPEDAAQLNKTQAVRKTIDEKIEELTALKAGAITKGLGGEKAASFVGCLQEIVQALTPPQDPLARVANIKFRQSVPGTLAKVKEFVMNLSLDPKKYPLLNLEADQKLLTSEDLIESLKGKNEAEISNTVLNPILEIQTALETLQTELLSNKMFEQSNQTIQELVALREQVDGAIAILSQIVDQQDYVATDEGSIIRQSIIENYSKTSDLIYGETGWDFMRYLLQESIAAENRFATAFKFFYFNFIEREDTFFSWPGPIRLDEQGRQNGCATAKVVLQKFINADGLINMATDFLDTNKDLFHEDVPYYQGALIPQGRSPQRKLLAQAESFERQKRELKRQAEEEGAFRLSASSGWDLQQMSLLTGDRSVGDVMATHEENRANAEFIQKFILEHHCN